MSTNETPSSVKKVRQIAMNCDSPFRRMPNTSTPPSRLMKILNPFEPHLIDRLHLPTFSPSVFAQISTPKNDKFKWTIDDISSLKPADIDEATISQHVSHHDSVMESMVQEKIDKFFKEEKIVPSPFHEKVQPVVLVRSPNETKACCSTQTTLSLPPVLPKHVEDVLAPFFQGENDAANTSLHRKLFEFDEQSSPLSSPPLSTGMSPIDFSPDLNLSFQKLERPVEIPELRDCTLSPIGRNSTSRSACRLDFSSHMSVDASACVPDVNKTLSTSSTDEKFTSLSTSMPDMSPQWDLEYRQVVLVSPDKTPISKLFSSQRKRLSDSFKEDSETDIMMNEAENVPNKRVRESGYQTDGTTFDEASLHVFASTPTKFKK